MWLRPQQLPRWLRRMAEARWRQGYARRPAAAQARARAPLPMPADAARVAAAQRLGEQRRRSDRGGIRMYDDARRTRLDKRLREAGFDEQLERGSEANQIRQTTQGVDVDMDMNMERHEEKRGRACGCPGREGESMCDGAGQGPTVAGFGCEGRQSGLPVGRSNG